MTAKQGNLPGWPPYNGRGVDPRCLIVLCTLGVVGLTADVLLPMPWAVVVVSTAALLGFPVMLLWSRP